jgi:hypothetical protein
VKLLKYYSPDRRQWDGHQARCRKCNVAKHKAFKATPEGRIRANAWQYRSKLKSRYGITEADYARLYDAQGGVCAICRKPPIGKSKSKRLHIDHCHTTGRIRGLLCTKCNSALGQFGDSLEGLKRVIAYLRR